MDKFRGILTCFPIPMEEEVGVELVGGVGIW